jgi:serine/threonine protein kinase
VGPLLRQAPERLLGLQCSFASDIYSLGVCVCVCVCARARARVYVCVCVCATHLSADSRGPAAGHHCPKTASRCHIRGETRALPAPLPQLPFAEQHTSAYVSIRQHTSAYVSIRQLALAEQHLA